MDQLTLYLQKLNGAIPEVKQATDKESRNAEALRGGFTGRGRGRGAFAARGFAAAGLTRHQADRKSDASPAKEG